MLIGALMPDTRQVREVSRSLLVRAMLRIREGRASEAWRDIHAVHRLSRLMAPAGKTRHLVIHLTAIALTATANDATLTLLAMPNLSVDDVIAIRQDLDCLPTIGNIGSSLVIERLYVLDMIVCCAGMTGVERDEFGVGKPAWIVRTSLDVNLILCVVNDA